ASGSLDLGQVTVSTHGTDGAPAVAAGLVAGTPAQATVLQLSASANGGPASVGVNVKLVSITQGARSWLGVDATGINLSLALAPLTVSVSGGALKLNRASGAGASKLDWASFVEVDPNHTPTPITLAAPLSGLTLPHLDVASTLDLHVSGSV